MKMHSVLLLIIVSGIYLPLSPCISQDNGNGIVKDSLPKKPLMAPSVTATEDSST